MVDNSPTSGVAVIGDLADSRLQPDRALAQRQLVAALDEVNVRTKPLQPLEPTIGDEFQAVYDSVAEALLATCLVELFLDPPLRCRFGLGVGEFRVIGRSEYGLTQDGSAWWSARDAIEVAKRRETTRPGDARAWLTIAPDLAGWHDDVARTDYERLTNGYLEFRSHVIGQMKPRPRRILRLTLQGHTQQEIADLEGIRQGSVSSALRASGGSVIAETLSLLRTDDPR
jgi:DNA-binding CsgD family transcriptional regulator